MNLAIDLDGTIDASKESIEFFSVLTNLLIGEFFIVILSNREPNSYQELAYELDCYGIEYNKIVITHKKADFIRRHKISIFFENQDENFKELKLDECLVFKVREFGNWEDGKWLGSKKTVKMID